MSSPLRPKRWRQLSMIALVALVAVEGLVRGVLFQGWFGEVQAMEPLRHPLTYSQPWENEYWQLRHVLGRAPKVAAERIDAQLGWVPTGVRAGEYDHVDGARLGGRRPVLLFGDSYAAGMAPNRALFQSLLDRSDLGGELAMLNYGCKGYGSDQALLLMRRALERWGDQDPVVLMGVLLDDGFDRARLDIRALPKPRLRVEDGALVPEREHVPSADDYLDSGFPWWKPWSWRVLVHRVLPEGASAALRGEHERQAATRTLAEALIETTVAEARERDLTIGFVLFHSERALRVPESLGWRESATVELLERLGVPYALSSEGLEADMRATERAASDYYYKGGMQVGHFNRKGQEAAFGPMLELIRTLTGDPE